MSLNVVTKSITLADGREITIETGKLAKQADGSVVVRMGNAMLLATVVSNKDAREGVDFLPMSVDYQEKFASAGKIPGGFLKREARLSDMEVLICRLVDRALRPLFPDDYHAETQIMISLISADKDVKPDALAALAASAALSVSDIPFGGPISEVRVTFKDGEYTINPTPTQIESADLEMIIAGTIENILMVEGEFNEVSEEVMIGAIKAGHEAIKDQCKIQIELTEAVGKTVKREYSHETNDEDLKADIRAKTYDKVYAVAAEGIADRHVRKEKFGAIKEEYIESLPEVAEGEDAPDSSLIGKYFHDVEKEAIRNSVLDNRIRLDGRKLNEIRHIWSEVDYLPGAHGSAIFTRGETQSLTTVTLGTKMDQQMIDSAMNSGYNKFMLHYNFPAFSTGEARPNRGTSRREVGHGNLALRALKRMIPQGDENPYTIRIVSDILESNGSSSMATVCAGSLAFKVTGTDNGITACQMDIKVDGLSYEVLTEALMQAKEGRAHILNKVRETLADSREDLKPHAPRSFTMKIEKELIGAVIGPGGKIIQEIQNESGATVVIEEVDGKGIISVFAIDGDSMADAIRRIKNIVAQPEVGETFKGKVK